MRCCRCVNIRGNCTPRERCRSWLEDLNLVRRFIWYMGVLNYGCRFGRLRLGYLRESSTLVRSKQSSFDAEYCLLFPKQIAESSDGILSIFYELMCCLISNVLQ